MVSTLESVETLTYLNEEFSKVNTKYNFEQIASFFYKQKLQSRQKKRFLVYLYNFYFHIDEKKFILFTCKIVRII